MTPTSLPRLGVSSTTLGWPARCRATTMLEQRRSRATTTRTASGRRWGCAASSTPWSAPPPSRSTLLPAQLLTPLLLQPSPVLELQPVAPTTSSYQSKLYIVWWRFHGKGSVPAKLLCVENCNMYPEGFHNLTNLENSKLFHKILNHIWFFSELWPHPPQAPLMTGSVAVSSTRREPTLSTLQSCLVTNHSSWVTWPTLELWEQLLDLWWRRMDSK